MQKFLDDFIGQARVEMNDEKSWYFKMDKELIQIDLYIEYLEKLKNPNNIVNPWDLDLFDDLPDHEKIIILEKFISDGTMFFGSYCYVVNYLYKIWDRYANIHWMDMPKNFPHSNYYNIISDIKHLLTILYENSQSLAEYTKRYQRKHMTKYISWHLCGLYPLMENGLTMLRKVIQYNYNDAQDSMMLGLYKLNPIEHKDYLVDIFNYWNTNNNVRFDSGTGMLYEFFKIVDKYKSHNIDLFEQVGQWAIDELKPLYDKYQ